jgi:hypothetical protein
MEFSLLEEYKLDEVSLYLWRRDAHMNAIQHFTYFNQYNIMLIFVLWIHRVFERVDKWNYEPRSTFKHKKHLPTLFASCFIFSFN